MNEETIRLVTAGLSFVAIIVSLVSLYLSIRKHRTEVRSRLLEPISAKRMDCYPELWQITSMVFRTSKSVKEEDFTKEWADDFYEQLRTWYYVQGHGIFMGEESKKLFGEVHQSLFDYQVEQGRDPVKKQVKELRNEIRAELGLQSLTESIGM